MQTSTLQAIAAALAIRPLTRAELVLETGLSLPTIQHACTRLNLLSDGGRPARYSLPAGPLLSITDPAADVVPRPWHTPIEDRRDRYREFNALELRERLNTALGEAATYQLDPADPTTLRELTAFLPRLASGLLALHERLTAASSHPDWYERLGGTLDTSGPA